MPLLSLIISRKAKGEEVKKLIDVLNGLFGFFLTVAILLIVVAIFACKAIYVQKRESTNYYNIDGTKIEMINSQNNKYYKLSED